MTYFNMSGTASYAAFLSFAGHQVTESFGPFPAFQWQIPEQITQLTGVAHNPVVQNFSM